MENLSTELLQIILLTFILIKSEFVIFLKKHFLKRKKERYDVLNSGYIKSINTIIESIKENICKNCKVNVYLFHNGGVFLNGISMLRYSCVYNTFKDFQYDKQIASNKDLIKVLLDLGNDGFGVLRKTNENTYYGLIYDKDNDIKGFIETNDFYFDLKTFNEKLFNVL